MTETPKTRKILLAPTGLVVEQVLLYSFPARDVELDDNARVIGHNSDDAFDPAVYEVGGGGAVVYDKESGEYLERHCRVVEVPEDFDESPWPERKPVAPWSDEICVICHRIQRLESGLSELSRFEQLMPSDFRNPITIPIMDVLLRKPIRDEIATLEAQIAEYQRAHPELSAENVRFPDEDEEETTEETADAEV